MSEIKFRAWDGKKWWQVTEIQLVDQDPELIALFGPHIEYVVHGIDKDGNRFQGNAVDTLVVRYTGLKDKNGKEIYEWDIVKSEHGVIAILVWREKEVGFGFDVKNPLWSHPTTSGMYGELEVIGNIYETPELVK